LTSLFWKIKKRIGLYEKMGKKYMYRYNARFYLKPSDSPFDELRTTCSDFVNELEKINCGIVLVPWSLVCWDRNVEVIKKSTDVPETSSEMRKFFDRLSPKRKGGFAYFSIYMVHNKPFSTIAKLLKGWFTEHKGGLYETNLQSERPILIGWFWQSSNEHNPRDLELCLQKKYNICSHIFWRVISTTDRGEIKEEDKVQALHIEVASET
jgi:hypothetical protein